MKIGNLAPGYLFRCEHCQWIIAGVNNNWQPSGLSYNFDKHYWYNPLAVCPAPETPKTEQEETSMIELRLPMPHQADRERLVLGFANLGYDTRVETEKKPYQIERPMFLHVKIPASCLVQPAEEQKPKAAAEPEPVETEETDDTAPVSLDALIQSYRHRIAKENEVLQRWSRQCESVSGVAKSALNARIAMLHQIIKDLKKLRHIPDKEDAT